MMNRFNIFLVLALSSFSLSVVAAEDEPSRTVDETPEQELLSDLEQENVNRFYEAWKDKSCEAPRQEAALKIVEANRVILKAGTVWESDLDALLDLHRCPGERLRDTKMYARYGRWTEAISVQFGEGDARTRNAEWFRCQGSVSSPETKTLEELLALRAYCAIKAFAPDSPKPSHSNNTDTCDLQ